MPETLIDSALTTLERVKEELGIDSGDTQYDDKLTRYINEASDFVEIYTGRTFGTVAGKEDVLSGSADSYLILNNRPILQINSVEVSGEAVTDFLVDPDDYKAGMLYRENGWVKSTYIVGLAGDQFGSRRTIVVNYDYGYVLPKDATELLPQTLPRSLEAIVIRLVTMKHKENMRDSFGLKELKQGRITMKFTNEMLTQSELRTLDKFKSMGVW